MTGAGSSRPCVHGWGPHPDLVIIGGPGPFPREEIIADSPSNRYHVFFF